MLPSSPHIYIELIFAVSGKQNIILPEWKNELHSYISEEIIKERHKSIIVKGMPDHIHIFVGLNPSITIGDLAEHVKTSSANYINNKQLVNGLFEWQEGYGGFSYAHSDAESLYQYILNQEEHHKRKSFKQEFIEYLIKFEIEFEEKDLFEWIDY